MLQQERDHVLLLLCDGVDEIGLATVVAEGCALTPL